MRPDQSIQDKLQKALYALDQRGLKPKECLHCSYIFWLPENGVRSDSRYCCAKCAGAACSKRYRSRLSKRVAS